MTKDKEFSVFSNQSFTDKTDSGIPSHRGQKESLE